MKDKEYIQVLENALYDTFIGLSASYVHEKLSIPLERMIEVVDLVNRINKERDRGKAKEEAKETTPTRKMFSRGMFEEFIKPGIGQGWDRAVDREKMNNEIYVSSLERVIMDTVGMLSMQRYQALFNLHPIEAKSIEMVIRRIKSKSNTPY